MLQKAFLRTLNHNNHKCSTYDLRSIFVYKKQRFGLTWGWVNNDIFLMNYLFEIYVKYGSDVG